MRVTIYTKLTPMGFYRLIWPAMVLQQAGYDVDIVDSDVYSWFSIDPRTGKPLDLIVPDTDVIVMQRVTQRIVVEAMTRWQEKGIRVIVDMDDNLRDIRPSQNPGAFDLLHESGTELSWTWAAEACRQADHVTVSTLALQDLYGKGRPVEPTILRNCVPAAYLTLPRYPGDGLIGWTGAFTFRQDDPSVMGASLGRLQAEGFKFGMVGPTDHIETAFRLSKPLERGGAVKFPDYPKAMSMFTVGVAPLKGNAFNRSKSWLKPLEFMSLGVPVVCSDTYEYGLFGDAVRHASTVRAWYQLLRELLTDEALREDMSGQGRELVADCFTYEGNAFRWWEEWTGQSR